jgi:hypothetical protein
VRVFESHCAPEPLAQRRLHPGKLKVAELRLELAQLGLTTTGTKAVLLQRLAAGREDVAAGTRKQTDVVVPGLGHIASMATATAAAREKQRAGEGRHVEHVADQVAMMWCALAVAAWQLQLLGW